MASWSPDRGDNRERTRADSRNPHACHGRCHGCDVHLDAIGVQARRRPAATRGDPYVPPDTRWDATIRNPASGLRLTIELPILG